MWDETEKHHEPKQPFFCSTSCNKVSNLLKEKQHLQSWSRHTPSTTDISLSLKKIKPSFQVCFLSLPPSLHKHSQSSHSAVGKLLVPATFPEHLSSSSALSGEQHTMHTRNAITFYKVQSSTEQAFSLDHVGAGIYWPADTALQVIPHHLIMHMFPVKRE